MAGIDFAEFLRCEKEYTTLWRADILRRRSAVAIGNGWRRQLLDKIDDVLRNQLGEIERELAAELVAQANES